MIVIVLFETNKAMKVNTVEQYTAPTNDVDGCRHRQRCLVEEVSVHCEERTVPIHGTQVIPRLYAMLKNCQHVLAWPVIPGPVITFTCWHAVQLAKRHVHVVGVVDGDSELPVVQLCDVLRCDVFC